MLTRNLRGVKARNDHFRGQRNELAERAVVLGGHGKVTVADLQLGIVALVGQLTGSGKFHVARLVDLYADGIGVGSAVRRVAHGNVLRTRSRGAKALNRDAVVAHIDVDGLAVIGSDAHASRFLIKRVAHKILRGESLEYHAAHHADLQRGSLAAVGKGHSLFTDRILIKAGNAHALCVQRDRLLTAVFLFHSQLTRRKIGFVALYEGQLRLFLFLDVNLADGNVTVVGTAVADSIVITSREQHKRRNKGGQQQNENQASCHFSVHIRFSF